MDCLPSDEDISGEEFEDLDEDSIIPKNEPQGKVSEVKTEVDATPSDPDNIRNINKQELENTVQSIQVKNKNNAEKINTRALSKNAVTYELEKFKKKLLVIFNHVNVRGEKPRVGTDKDVTALTNTFENFGFTVIVKTDLKRADIMAELNAWADIDYSDYGCVAVAVLTHGTKYGDLMAEDRLYNEEDIIMRLKTDKNSTFITKPRILIIQACRGHEDMDGTLVYQGNVREEVFKDTAGKELTYTMPVEADMLIMHSSYAGKPSHRTENGSWYIQTLCKTIDDLAVEEDLLNILLTTNRTVAIDFEVSNFKINKNTMTTDKQMPVITSTLTRKLYLRKYRE